MMIEFTGNEANAAEMLGILTALWSLLHFIVAPIVGELSDCFGRRRILIFLVFIMALSHFICATAPKKRADSNLFYHRRESNP